MMLNKPRELRLVDFKIFQTIGVGSQGRVKLGYDQQEQKYVVIKYIGKHKLMRLNLVDHCYNELKIGYNLRHPFLCQTLGIIQDNKYLMLVEQFIQGGSLRTRLDEMQKLDQEVVMVYSAMVLLMIEYLHAKNIIYRNFKPENLMLDNQGYLKLVDFGYSKVIVDKTFTLCGTPEYMAPETLLNQGQNKGVDFWALGILIYEMMVGVDPFGDQEGDPMITFTNIINQKLKFPKNFNRDAASICRHLLAKNQVDRYGVLRNKEKDIKTHRFYYKANFEAILAKQIKVPFKPILQGENDVSRFETFQNSHSLRVKESVSKEEDPFKDW